MAELVKNKLSADDLDAINFDDVEIEVSNLDALKLNSESRFVTFLISVKGSTKSYGAQISKRKLFQLLEPADLGNYIQVGTEQI